MGSPPVDAADPAAGAAASMLWARGDFLSLTAWAGVLSSLAAALVGFGRFMFPRVLFEPPPQFDAGAPDTYVSGPAPRPLDRVKIALGPEGNLVVDKSAIFRMHPGRSAAEQYPESVLRVAA